MIALLVIGILILITGIVLKIYGKEIEDFDGKLWGKVVAYVGVGMILLSIILTSFTTVPAGSRGVVIRFDAVTGRILSEGLNMKTPFVDSVVVMSVQKYKYEADATSASKDLQDVSTSIALNYRLKPEMSAIVYQYYRGEYIDRLAAPAIQETVKQVTSKYIAEDLILKRDIVKSDIEQGLKTRLESEGIEVDAVSITNFTFSEVFTAAIEAKVSALQAVLEATNKLERVRVEAQQAEAQAIGIANARIAQANGEAEYIKIVTEAQVNANNAISESLTPEILHYIMLDRFGEDIKLWLVPNDGSIVLPSP